MRRFTLVVFLILMPLLLAACAPGLSRKDAATAESLALPARLALQVRQGGQFALTTRERYERPGDDLMVYIEGDGLAWATRTLPSNDPTPDQPVALALAAQDSHPNVVWIARPCQYLPVINPGICPVYYWTHGRFAPEAVRAIDEVVTQAKAAARARRIHLIGYSGGGGVAMLVAAGRSDVASIRTVAGNLDTEAFTRLHRVSPMTGSLNPASIARRLEQVPQLHLVGSDDAIVPVIIARGYVDAMSRRDCARIVMVPGATHERGWTAAWPAYVGVPPVCAAGAVK